MRLLRDVVDIKDKLISIHAPVWGATRADLPEVREQIISIHAPVWGATTLKIEVSYEVFNFNPRTRMGCDKAPHS